MSAICPCPNCVGPAKFGTGTIIAAGVIAYEIVRHGNSILVAIDVGLGSVVGFVWLILILTGIRALIRRNTRINRERIAIESARVTAPALPAPARVALPAPARQALPGPRAAAPGLPAEPGAWVPRPVRGGSVRL
jgi:hypothetical protein